MRILFRKNKEGKESLLCVRDDGSETWAPRIEGAGSSFVPIPHDLAHYVAESVMGFRHAFFGTINAGRSLDTPMQKNSSDPIDRETEAEQAEALAGALTMELSPTNANDFYTTLAACCRDRKTTVPTVTIEQLTQMRTLIHAYQKQYRELPNGSDLEVVF